MSEQFGPLPIPLVAPAAGAAAGDPLLTTTLAFFQAVLNQNTPLAWESVFKDDPNAPVVKTTYAHDPEDPASVFNDTALPALYFFRSDVKEPVWIAEDWETQESRCTLYWIMPLVATREKRALRLPMINGIARALDRAVEFGRDPSWVVAGDPDPKAALQGSVFATWAQFFEFQVGAWKPHALKLPMLDRHSRPRVYDALKLTCRVVEHLHYDLTRWPAVNALDLKVNIPDTTNVGDGGVPMGEQQAGLLPFSTWAPSTAYALGAYVQPARGGSFYYRCTTAGVSAVQPPTFATGVGMTVSDGTVVWTTTASVP